MTPFVDPAIPAERAPLDRAWTYLRWARFWRDIGRETPTPRLREGAERLTADYLRMTLHCRAVARGRT